MPRRAPTFALVGLAVVLLLGAQPAFAYTELGTTGTVGVHSLVDTSSAPGAECRYRYVSAEDLWELRRIVVKPPRMRAVPGQGNEKVAWRYTIQRRTGGFLGFGPWRDRFTSVSFIAYTDSTHYAAFSEGSASVSVPFEPGMDAVADYRVVETLTWFKASGGVLGTARLRVDWYRVTQGTARSVERRMCPDYTVPI